MSSLIKARKRGIPQQKALNCMMYSSDFVKIFIVLVSGKGRRWKSKENTNEIGLRLASSIATLLLLRFHVTQSRRDSHKSPPIYW
ncbi:hypothetical protein CSA56_11425 [candidate division KSB3 bacterium]|uniref:Uncharacterized protein n=1 Tax=candidate division KSB3 bacterium TaxID=2044937 RepID=A0A2G6KFE3_9BACT|nr:MAG: hypothetical protein CSA56_11425 [candidate division KSB3 bacterium]